MAVAPAVDKATAIKAAVDKAEAAADKDTVNNNNNNNNNDNVETVFNTEIWSIMEIEKYAQSLCPNGNNIKHETMGELVTSCSIPAIKSYYNKNKAKLLCISKQYVPNDNGNNLLAEDWTEDSVSDDNSQNNKDCSSIGAEEVRVEKRVATINIIVGAIG